MAYFEPKSKQLQHKFNPKQSSKYDVEIIQCCLIL